MTAWPQLFATNSIVAASVVDTTETIVASVAVTEDVAPAGFFLAIATFTVGTNGTAVRARLRLDSVSGTVIGDATAVNVTAGQTVNVLVFGRTLTEAFAARTVHLTLQQTAATAAGTVQMAGILAITQQ